MRTLRPNERNKQLQQIKNDRDTEARFDNLEEEINQTKSDLQNLSDDLDEYKAQNQSYVTTNKVTASEADIGAIDADDIETSTLIADSADISRLSSDYANIQQANIEQGTAGKMTINELDSNEISTSTLEANEITTSVLNADTANISHFSFDEATFNKAEVSTLVSEDIDSNNIKANSADIVQVSADTLNADIAQIASLNGNAARLNTIENEQIWHKYSHETLEPPVVVGGSSIIEIPYFSDGYYALSLRDSSDNEIFSVLVTNSASNLTFAYSRKTYTTSQPASLSECKIRTYNSRPQLYLSTQSGGTLYFHYQGLDKLDDASPSSYTTWPFNISTSTTLNYICYHRAATVFTQHLDYGDNTSPPIGGATLYLTPSSVYADASVEGIEYNTMSDVPFNIYLPDQSLNTNDAVTFKKASVDELAISSITENFMFLRSRADGTFEVVLAVNNDTIQGVQDLDNPITSRSIFNWNGIALGGNVAISDFVTIDTSDYICTNEGDFYRRTQYMRESGTPDIITKAIKKKIGADYLPFRIVSNGQYADRDYIHYEVASGDFAGLYFEYFTDDTGEMYSSNQNQYDLTDWNIPLTLYDEYLLPCKYFLTGYRYPVDDSEGTNEYHLKHLAASTITHGDHYVASSLYVGEKMHVPEIEASSLNVADKLKVSAASTYIGNNVTLAGSTLNVSNDSFFNNIDTALIKAEQMRAKLNHINIDNEENADEAGIIATFDNNGTPEDVHLDIVKTERESEGDFITVQRTILTPGTLLRTIGDQPLGIIEACRATRASSGMWIQIKYSGSTWYGYDLYTMQNQILPSTYADGTFDELLTDTSVQNGAWWVSNALGGGNPLIGQPPIDFVSYPNVSVRTKDNTSVETVQCLYSGWNLENHGIISRAGLTLENDVLKLYILPSGGMGDTGYTLDLDDIDLVHSIIGSEDGYLITDLTNEHFWEYFTNGVFPTLNGQVVYFVIDPVVHVQRSSATMAASYDAAVDGDILAKRKDSVAYKLPTFFDSADDKLTTVSVPFTNNDVKLKKALVAERASPSTLVFDLKWDDKVGSGGSGTVKHYATTASYLIDAAITDPNDDRYIANDALVIIDDADQDYLIGEEE